MYDVTEDAINFCIHNYIIFKRRTREHIIDERY